MKSFVQVLEPKLEFHYWQALFAPAATPQPVVDTLNAAIQKTVSDSAVLATWKK